MRRIVARLAIALVFVSALTLVLTDTQDVAARPPRAAEAEKPVVLAHLSDTHIGLRTAPQAAMNLRRAVELINQREVDAVLVTGDLGQNPESWDVARQILSGLRCDKVFIVPGNHDVRSDNVERWRREMGPDYHAFRVRGLTIYGIDSQLLGNWDNFSARTPAPLPEATRRAADEMLAWLEQQAEEQELPRGGGEQSRPLVFAMQHVPAVRAGDFPPDPKPYWVMQEPYRGRELELLRRLGVKHVFAGHWHRGMVFEAEGITWHVAPSTSWLPWGGELGFAMHTIAADGSVKTEFVRLD